MSLTFEAAAGSVPSVPKRFKSNPAPITVEQINADRLFDIASKFWSPATAGKHAVFDAQLIGYIYSHEMLRNRFTSRRMSMLELSQYLDLYLWPNYEGVEQQKMQVHVLSIVALINEKFRQRADAWRSIRDDPKEFPALLDTVMQFIMLYFNETNCPISSLEMTQLIQFLTNCCISLEEDIVRECVQKLFGLPIWSCLTPFRRQIELKKRPKLGKIWLKYEKSEAKRTDAEREKQQTYSHFMFNLMEQMIKLLNALELDDDDTTMAEGEQQEELSGLADVQDAKNTAGNVRVLEKFFDLLVECLSSLHTRRFFVFILDEYHFTMRCRMSPFVSDHEDDKSAKVLLQLLQQIDVYMQFELSLTGADLPRKEIIGEHYEKVQLLQKNAYKMFPDKLRSLFLAPVKDLVKDDGGAAFKKLVGSLSFEQLGELAVSTGIIPTKSDESSLSWLANQETLLSVLANYYVLKASPLEQLNAEPLYPTEAILWNKSLVPDDQHDLSDLSLVLPKLNLQFLSLHDYLMRNYYLFRLESAYEIRQDIEDVVLRMKPWQSEHDGRTLFGGWARMAQPLVEFKIVEVGDARAGERAPERVRGEFTVTLDVRDDVRNEWEQLRVHDVCFLLCVQAHAPRGTRFDPDGNVPEQTGIRFVRGCEIEGLLDESGKLIEEVDRIAMARQTGKLPMQFSNLTRRYRVMLDPNQYYEDICAVREAADRNDAASAENPYQVLNIVMRRRSEANNFKAVLQTLRVLMNSGHTVVPDWLKDVLLGYGDPGSASWQMLPNKQNVLAFNDTFLDYQHVLDCFPQHNVQLKEKNNDAEEESGGKNVVPPFRLHFDFKTSNAGAAAAAGEKSVVAVEPYQPPQLSPYPQHAPKRNQVRFTAAQTGAILSGMQPGLTVIVGPPGTGKTDVAVQIIANLYHNFPIQRTIIVTHSNQALNQIFEKLMLLDIDERHLLRLGHGEEALETSKDFSRYGRVDYVLRKRLELLKEVERLQASQNITGAAALSHTCETSNYFCLYQVQPRWRKFSALLEKSRAAAANSLEETRNLFEQFPFRTFFADAPRPLFSCDSTDIEFKFDADCKKAQLYWRYIKHVFDQLEEFRSFELLRGGPERARYLLIKEAKIVAMTCTHAAIRRQDLVSFGFTYDNIVMEEAAQILEVETFIPLLLQRPEHGQHNRLKRWIMLGDHNQLPPIIQNRAFEKYSNMEQSLFARFIRLGVPHVLLNAQGRSRPAIRELYSWRYGAGKLGDLPHVCSTAANSEYAVPNAGFRFDFQLIDVDDFNGVGESAPSRHFIQNLAEAEYMVATYMYMRLLGYPAERITMLAAYQGQRQLLQDIVDKRCGENGNPLFGEPARISTVDKYQGQQNDYVLLSMVRTSQVGYLRDVRRIVVALSRARLGLYVFARARLFLNCYETAPAFQIMARNNKTLKLHLLPDEKWPLLTGTDARPSAALSDAEEKAPAGIVVIPDMPAMCNFVRDAYERRVREDPERMTALFAELELRKQEAMTFKRPRGNAQQAGNNKVTDFDANADMAPFYELPHDIQRRKREQRKELQQHPQKSVKADDEQQPTATEADNAQKLDAVAPSDNPKEVIIRNEITDSLPVDE